MANILRNCITQQTSCSFSYFNLCSNAHEWYYTMKKSWEWRVGKRQKKASADAMKYLLGSVLLLERYGIKILVEDYRERRMVYDRGHNLVKLYELYNFQERLFSTLELTPNLAPKHDLIFGRMNSKYCIVNTISYILIYKGFHSIHYHMAFGFEGNNVVDITEELLLYEPENLNEDHNYTFDPVELSGDKLLISIKSYGMNMGPVLIVNLQTKQMVRLILPSEYETVNLTKHYLSFLFNKKLIIYDYDGRIVMKNYKYNLIHNNDKFVSVYIGDKIDIYELKCSSKVRSFTADRTVTFMELHPFLNYLFFYTSSNNTLYVYEIESGKILWQRKIDVPLNFGFKFRFSGGYILIYDVRPSEKATLLNAYSVRNGDKEGTELLYGTISDLQMKFSGN